jgi:hypothetical protein
VTKKTRERAFAQLLQNKNFPSLTLDPIDYERPGFHLTDGHTTIGLELTYLVHPDEMATDQTANQLEELLDKKRAARILRNPDTILAKISLFAVPRSEGQRYLYWPPAREHDAFCDELLDFVERNATGENEDLIPNPATEPRLARIIRGLHITKTPRGGANIPWDLMPKARFVGINQALLATRITEKKRLAVTYDTAGLDQPWLAIIAGIWLCGIPP